MRGCFRPARRIAVWFLGALERSWAGAAWLVTSHVLLSLGGVLWVVSKAGDGSLGAWVWWLVVSGLHGLGLLSEVLIVIEPPSYSVERARPFWGWALLWLMPVHGLLPIALWRYRQLSGGARERSLVAQAYRFQGAVEARHDWRTLAARLRAGWSRVALREQWRRPLGLGRRSQLGDLDLRVGRAARWKAAQLLVDGALLAGLVLPDQVVDESRARDLSRSLLQAFWLYLGWLLVLMALKLGHVLAVWSDRQGGLRWLDDKPSLRLAALGSAALWLGMLSAAAVRIDGVEAGILILAYGSALAMIGTWVTISLLAPILPAVARDPEDRWFWPLTFGVVLTLAAGAALVARHNPSLVLSALDPLILLGLSLLSATWLRWRHQLPPCHRPWLWIILTMAPGGGLTAPLWPGWRVRGDQRGP
ncbi:MAG TPA: hypothetical protein VF017_18395 [Thermoanaerobaculia bacterium]|nr:hypothetical protein [Thermoanaerobaculia bacterium]